MTAAARQLVATASRVLAAQGHDDLIWGHASVRDPDGRGAWLKAAEWGLGEVTADRVHLVDASGAVLEGRRGPAQRVPHPHRGARRPPGCRRGGAHPPAARGGAGGGRPAAAAGEPRGDPARAAGGAALHRDGGPHPDPGPGQAPRRRAGRGQRAVPGEPRHRDRGPGPRDGDRDRGDPGAGLPPAGAHPVLWRPAELVGPAESTAKRQHIYSERALHGAWDLLVRQLPG